MVHGIYGIKIGTYALGYLLQILYRNRRRTNIWEIIFMYFIYGVIARDCGVVCIFKETQSRDRHVLFVRNIGDAGAFK